jgi:hypothetical protein
MGTNEARVSVNSCGCFLSPLGYLLVIVSQLIQTTSSTVNLMNMPKYSIRMFTCNVVARFGHVIILLGGVLTNEQQLNVVLLADTSTDVRQWPAIVDWAQTRIHSDQLLPENYSVRWAIQAQFIYDS